MFCGAKIQTLRHKMYQHCNKWMNNCNKRSGAGLKSLPRTHKIDKVATGLLKDEVTAVDGEMEVEVVGVGDSVQSDVVLGVGLTVVAQHDTTYIGGDSIVANSNFFHLLLVISGLF